MVKRLAYLIALIFLCCYSVQQTLAATPFLVQRTDYPVFNTGSGTFDLFGNGRIKFALPNPSPGGNMIFVSVTWPAGAVTTSIADNQGNSYSLDQNFNDGNQQISQWHALNVAPGTQVVTITFSGGSLPSHAAGFVAEFGNIATSNAVDSTSQTGSGTGTAVSTSQLSGLAADDLVVQFGINDNTGNTTSVSAGGGFNLGGVDIPNPNDSHFWQWGVMNGNVTPTMTITPSSTWLAGAVAFKSASAGNALQAGIKVTDAQGNAIDNAIGRASPFTIQFPCPTATNLLIGLWIGASGDLTAVSDSVNGSWTSARASSSSGASGTVHIWYRAGATGGTAMTVTLTTVASTSLGDTFVVYAVQGAATSNPLDLTAEATGIQNAAGSLNIVTITPTTSNGLVVACVGVQSQNTDPASWNPGSWDPPDENNAWGHYYNPSAGAFQFNVRTNGGAANNWESQAAAFKAAGASGGASSIVPTAGTPQSTTINTAFALPLVATATDSRNNPVSGVEVTFTPPAGGASGTFAGGVNTATTNASGVATSAVITANGTAGGPYNVVASAIGASSANFALTNIAVPPGKVAITSGSGQSTTISTAFAAPLVVTVTDAGNNPVRGVLVTFTPPANGASGTFVGGVNTVITNAGGVATTAVFTANAIAGPYTVTATVAGVATSAVFSLTNNNPVPTMTTISPNSAPAGGAGFTLTVNGANFVGLAVVNFNGAAKTTTFISTHQVTATITPADIAKGGTFPVTVTNPAPGGGNSAPTNFNVSNPVPTISSVAASGKAHAPGGAPLTLTVTGSNYVANSVINFGFGSSSKAEPTTFVGATQLTAAIPASDVATAGNANVTVTNPNPGGGTTSTVSFTLDGFTVAGPETLPSVNAGQQAMIQVAVTPTTNGFANAITFNVSGLPANSTATFNPASVTPNGSVATTTLTITTMAPATVPPSLALNRPGAPLLRPLLVLWLTALLAGFSWMQLIRRVPQPRRYLAVVPLALLLVTGAFLAGCAGLKSGAPGGSVQLTITASSGTLSQTTTVTLTVK